MEQEIGIRPRSTYGLTEVRRDDVPKANQMDGARDGRVLLLSLLLGGGVDVGLLSCESLSSNYITGLHQLDTTLVIF